MKIAIPLFDTRVSPRFDCAQKFLVLWIENGQVLRRQVLLLKERVLIERIKKLAELKINALICSGIDGFSERQLFLHGIKVFSWITGEIEDVLRCFLEGNLESGMMMGAGGRCCGRWRFRQGKGPCGGGRRGHN